MDSEGGRLRAQAAKARRILAAASDLMTRRQLSDYALECDAKAEHLERDANPGNPEE